MRAATALASALPGRYRPGDHIVDQPPLPFPAMKPVLPVPLERGSAVETHPLRHRSARFLQALVEVLAGERPVRQMAAWMDPQVYQHLCQRLTVDASRPGRTRRGARIVSVHVSMVTPTVGEVAGRMVHHGRSRAIAIRLELVTDHRQNQCWKCTALEWA